MNPTESSHPIVDISPKLRAGADAPKERGTSSPKVAISRVVRLNQSNSTSKALSKNFALKPKSIVSTGSQVSVVAATVGVEKAIGLVVPIYQFDLDAVIFDI